MEGVDFFAERLISWYHKHKRDLPFRQTRDPYRIWLSEIILQQTRVAQGLPYYERFTDKYPSVFDLAAAPEDEVLRLWQGLGYYSRARNLHYTAKVVAGEMGGKFPETAAELQKLKGIGVYTASAIASFAFLEKTAVVDGNVYRVLSRVFGLDDDISEPKSQQKFAALAAELLPDKEYDTFNHALMEFGAMHCTPKKTDCVNCIFRDKCIALAEGKQLVLPVKKRKTKVRKRFFHYLIFEFEEKRLLKKRPLDDIWRGLYDFPLLESEKPLDEEALIKAVTGKIHDFIPVLSFRSKELKHVLSHQKLFVSFFHFQVQNPETFKRLGETFNAKDFSRKETEDLPKAVLISNYLNNSQGVLF